jgi:hypothetical protein
MVPAPIITSVIPSELAMSIKRLVRAVRPKPIVTNIPTILINDTYTSDDQLSGERLKGTVSRDFLLQVFLMSHLPPSP